MSTKTANTRSWARFWAWVDWRSVHYRLPVYAYPLFLVLVEWFLRSFASLETKTFIGPTLAAVGASLLLPLTVKKPLTVTRRDRVVKEMDEASPELAEAFKKLSPEKQSKVSYIPQTEAIFVQVCWLSVLMLTLIWVWALFLSIKSPNDLWLDRNIPANYVPGFINFFLGFMLSEIREGEVI